MPCLTENEICRCMPVSVSMKPRKRNMHRVAQHARGPKLAGCCSAVDRRWPASRKGCYRPARVAPARDRNRPREMLLALAPARTLTDRPAALCVGTLCRPCPPQARSGLIPQRPHLRGLQRESRPGGWRGHLAVPPWLWGEPRNRTPPAEPRWLPPPPARRRTLGPWTGGIPFRLARNVRDPSGSGSTGIMAWGCEGVEKVGGYCAG